MCRMSTSVPQGCHFRGSLKEFSYPVHHYIDASRQFVSKSPIDPESIGRNRVDGDPIIKKCNVYLPAGYDENDTTKRYRVLYLLHGVGGSEWEWLNSNGKMDDRYIICNILDHLIASGEIEPLIVVFPTGAARTTGKIHRLIPMVPISSAFIILILNCVMI